jgi:hypothetical protein
MSKIKRGREKVGELDCNWSRINRNLIIFDKAYERSIRKWIDLYMMHASAIGMDDKKKKAKLRKYMKKSYNVMLLREFKKMCIAFASYDTAYRGFFDIFCKEFCKEMFRRYNGKKNKVLLFDSPNMYNLMFLKVLGAIDKEELKESQDIKGDITSPYMIFRKKGDDTHGENIKKV